MKRVKYKSFVQIRTTSEVISATCTCPAGGTPTFFLPTSQSKRALAFRRQWNSNLFLISLVRICWLNFVTVGEVSVLKLNFSSEVWLLRLK
ncbi:hypothetical protein TNCT_678411 [Trichonephila clavata]|uniref:Uncharacterized protein n=1 Tax=Trichonephila clavata TaxID=2740835 RepID=A0A8X6LXF1_TRICU|nr:hypothetical protein TNCT_678411 [Trichonephila clavata]